MWFFGKQVLGVEILVQIGCLDISKFKLCILLETKLLDSSNN